MKTAFLVLLLAIPRAIFPQAFDSASIKPSQPGTTGSTFEFLPDGGLRIGNGTLRQILETAYDLRDFEISGGRDG